MSDRIDVALVGCGAIAGAHAEALAERDDVRLVLGVDPSPEARERAAREWGCDTSASLDEALGGGRPDAAVVCSPPATHAETGVRLLEDGVHVLCEKPLATGTADARRMADKAALHDRVLDVSAKFRHVQDLREAARRVAAGDIGEPVYYEVTFCASVDMEGRWNLDPDRSGGGVVMDNAPHALDVLSHVIDSPVERVTAGFSQPVVDEAVEDTAEILFRTRQGTQGRIGLSWTYFTKDLDFLMVQGTEGGIRVGWPGGQIRMHGEEEWTPFGEGYDKTAAFDRQTEHFLAKVRGERPADPGPGVRAVEMIREIYRAAETGTWRELGTEASLRAAI